MSKSLKILLLSFITLSGIKLNAQQITQHSNYFVNPYIINPSLAGYSGNTNAFFIRNQKNLGFDGGNVSNLLTVDGSLFDNKIGLGITLQSEQMGPSLNQSGYLSLAYTVKLSEENKLGFGLSGGIADRRYDLSNAVVQDLNDPMLQMGFPARKTFFDATAGVYLDLKKFQFGIGIPQIIGNQISISESQTRIARHYSMHALYNLLISEHYELSLVPFVKALYVPGAPFQYDVNLKLDMKRIGWFNIAWRSNYALAASIGFRIKNNFQLGYSYHLPMNNTKSYGVSQQEVIVGISFGGGGKLDKKELEEAQKEKERLQLENARLENERDSLMKLKTKAEVDLRNEKSNNKELQDSISKINDKNLEFLEENDQLLKENEELKKLIEELKKNSGTKTVEVPDPKTKEENEKLRKENEKLKKEIEAHQSNNDSNTIQPDPILKGENEKLKSENEKLKKEIESLRSNTTDDSERLRKENEKLLKQIEDLKSNSNSSNSSSSTNNNGTNSNNNSSFNGDIRKSINDHFYEMDQTTDAPKGFYVVSGAFAKMEFAESWLAKNKADFPDARIIHNTRNNLNYIILGYSAEKTETYSTYTKGKNAGISKIWILDYE